MHLSHVRPRFTMRWLMIAVVIVALDLGVGRVVVQYPGNMYRQAEIILLGGFPMADILLAGFALLLTSRRDRPAWRPGLVGFEVFGLAAWLAFLTWAWMAGREISDSLVRMGRSCGVYPGFRLASLAAILLLLPQVVLGALGWWVIGRSATRRSVATGREGKP